MTDSNNLPRDKETLRLLDLGCQKTFKQPFAQLKKKANSLGVEITKKEIDALILTGKLLDQSSK